MIYLFLCLVWLLFNLKKSKVVLFLISIQLLSVLFALVSGMSYPVEKIEDILHILFTFLIVYLFTNPLSLYDGRYIQNLNDNNTIRKTAKLFNVFSFMAMLLIIYVLVNILPYLSNISDYRYGDGRNDLLESLGINNNVILLLTLLSCSGYFLITFHFFYMLNRDFKFSIYCLLGSFVIPIYGIMFLSRSYVILYIMAYACNLLYFYKSLDTKSKARIVQIGTFAIALISTYFLFVTVNRFEGRSDFVFKMSNEWFSSRPVLASLVSYFSQWYRNGLQILDTVGNDFYYGYFSLPYFYIFLQRVGLLDFGNQSFGVFLNLLYESVIPNHWPLFNGITAVLYVEFGYMGTVILALIFNRILTSCIRKNKTNNNLSNILLVNVLYVLPSMSIVGFYLKTLFYTMLLIVSIFVCRKIR